MVAAVPWDGRSVKVPVALSKLTQPGSRQPSAFCHGRAMPVEGRGLRAEAVFEGYGGDWGEFDRGTHSGVFSSRVGVIKPEPAIYELAAARFGAQPDELVFLDDHLPNVLAARAMGWNVLHFSDAATAEAAMRDAGWMA